MQEARKLRPEDLQANPLLEDLLVQARAGGEPLVSYQGLTVVIQPVEDITHTFSPDELRQFAEAYQAAEDPGNRLTAAQALARFRGRAKKNG